MLLSEMQEKLNDGKGKIVTIITTVSEGETEYGFLVFNDGEANELSNFPASYTGLQNQEDAVMEEYLYAYQQVSENMKNYIE